MLLDRFLPRTEFEDYADFKRYYRVNVPKDFNFAYDVVDAFAAQDPDKEALLYCNDEGAFETYTFADMKRLSDRAAAAFSALGIGKGDTVMLILKQRVEVWVCMLALHKLGGIVIPATYQLMTKDIVYRVQAAEVKMICAVNEPELVGNLTAARFECPQLMHIALVGGGAPDGFLDFNALTDAAPPVFARPTGKAGVKATDPMLIYFSSGTTGMPKMVLHDYTYPLGHITTAKYWQHVEDGGRHLTVSDSGWAKFGWGKIYGQWLCGAVNVAYDNEKFNPQNMCAMIEKLRLTSFCAPPTVYRFLIREDLSKYDFSSVKHCCIAGEPLNPEVYHQFLKATGLAVHEGFGQSETSVFIGNFGFFPVKPGSTGKPAPLYDVDIVDEHGRSCEDGEVGTIVIKNIGKSAPVGLFKRYLRDEDANARAFKNGYYATGDNAWRDSEGYFWFVGRADDVIKCSGYRIGPFEVESALLTHPSVLECAITAVPDPVRGQVVKATVVLNKNFTPSDDLKKELQDHVKKVTAPYKYPRVLEFVTELPKTVSGKIRRMEIRTKDSGK